jgi:hypothetical protein
MSKKKPSSESKELNVGKAALKVSSASLKLLGKGVQKSGAFAWRKRGGIRGAAVGVANGTFRVGRNAQAHVRFDDRVKNREVKLKQLAEEQTQLAAQFQQQTDHAKNQRDSILDSIAIGGQTLYSYRKSPSVPEDILQAYKSAYPDQAKNRPFDEFVDSIPDAELVRYASVLKGKLFELRYVEWLNDGNLPDGFQASLASSPTNPDWDIQVSGPDGQISELIQAKATHSVRYVLDALRQNPHIDVVTTSEVAAQLVTQGIASGVIDSGMSVEGLDRDIFSALDSGEIAMQWAPPAIALALIAFSSYSKKELSAYDKSRNFGERGAQAYLVYLLGGAVAVTSGTVWLGVIGAIGSRLFIGSGAKKADQLEELSRTIHDCRRAQKRTRSVLQPSFL